MLSFLVMQAAMRAVRPSVSVLSTSAPLCNRVWTTASCPSHVALKRALSPQSLFLRLMSTPLVAVEHQPDYISVAQDAAP